MSPKQASKLVAIVVLAIFLSGCVTLFSTATRMSGKESGPAVKATFEPQRGFLRIRVTPQREEASFWLQAKANWIPTLLDLVVGINAALYLFKFPSSSVAYAFATTAGLGIAAADFVVEGLVGGSATQPIMWVRVKANREAGTVKTLFWGAFRSRSGQTQEVWAPFTASDVGVPLTVEFLDAGNKVVAQNDLRISRESWLAANPGDADKLRTGLILVTRLLMKETYGERAVVGDVGGVAGLEVVNEGTERARGLVARLDLDSAERLTSPGRILVGDLKPGEKRSLPIQISAPATVKDGTASLTVRVEDERGFDVVPVKLVFETRALRLPELVADKSALVSLREGIPQRGEELILKVLVHNAGKAAATDVKARLRSGHGDVLVLDQSPVFLGEVPEGTGLVATFSVFVKNGYQGPDKLPLEIEILEARRQANRSASLAVKLAGGPRLREVFVPAGDLPAQPVAIQALPDLRIDVDEPLSRPVAADPDAVAVVIGIERYNSRVPAVPYAERDAAVMRDYFLKVLGVPAENAFFLANEQATKGAIQATVEGELKKVVKKGKSRVFVYFSGHGAPDIESQAAYLVPHDGFPEFTGASCYSLQSLFDALKALEARKVTVILDSCFSGFAARRSTAVGLVAEARPLYVTALPGALPPEMSVLAASEGSQISFGYPEKHHGLFTYFVLRRLRQAAEKSERLTVGALQEYVADNVARMARRQGRSQTPVLLGAKDDVLVERR